MPRARRHRTIIPLERIAVCRASLPDWSKWCPPRGLNRVQAAAYVGVGITYFDRMVRDGRMPKPLRGMGRRKVWDRHQLDEAIVVLRDEAPEHDILPEPQV
jgi:predicted DNA-binding transcriptional regulator AlpA